ncbi:MULTISPECIES: hypothetical protein [Enterococcus]|uniref:hypothetical protein n=1 Tax=Enterococcus TaxID=1350 RepID=UPI000F50643F|nr:hypothetical protein [Enterococcus faecium]ROY68718.1 hypothetical protein EGW73_12390 [Enterococcus faecium]ROZ03640.1 hypothetical protein EGW81_12510 [Enterococcus faecium]ROZ16513.1 hypothetical protein EGX09_12515 [Enterococcus faecium]
MKVDGECLTSSYKSIYEFFEEKGLDTDLLYQFYIAFRGQQLSFPMKMYDRELVAQKIETMVQENHSIDSRKLTDWYGFSTRWIQSIIRQQQKEQHVHG